MLQNSILFTFLISVYKSVYVISVNKNDEQKQSENKLEFILLK